MKYLTELTVQREDLERRVKIGWRAIHFYTDIDIKDKYFQDIIAERMVFETRIIKNLEVTILSQYGVKFHSFHFMLL